ncbi:MAG: TIGR04255 family protein [Candidatus Acidiferrales bacterium]
MTTVHFANAPLVELIAELRWNPQGTVSTPNEQVTVMMPFPGGTKLEEFFMRLGGALYQVGFQRSERLVPPGFPLLPAQAVVRYKSNDPPKSSAMFQAGAGLFSVHAIPPYHSWAKFVPFVEHGVAALLECRNESERQQPFTELRLRYIDLFGESLIKGRGIRQFLSEVLGISATLPDSITRLSESKDVSSLNLLVVVPIADGTMTINVADGKAAGQSGILLDTTVSSKSSTPARTDAILKRFDDAHAVIHDVFMKLTIPIQDLMKPQAEAIQ